ncbi:BrnT family toxin [Methylobacterium sp. 17Sr1-1]|uniref:BrnT family toxin n=1 Tax=Methylobacterium sp. 17Sr1-1 TaxID=2202826 RepID=UPI000D6FF679|nr:BrnT family toxin [Methylobacterium sp. 17Sr1-1]AWN50922.1 BrnT family toxin [Methylobacterium sp. 17Sr1-1]
MGENETTEWADAKNARNLEERGIDFADLEEAFDGRFALVTEDIRHAYGERRFNMLAELRGVLLNITFTPRPPKNRIISARVASRKERRAYYAKQQSS